MNNPDIKKISRSIKKLREEVDVLMFKFSQLEAELDNIAKAYPISFEARLIQKFGEQFFEH